jgi:hypothetical protein
MVTARCGVSKKDNISLLEPEATFLWTTEFEMTAH